MAKTHRPILAFDFDGVLHSYSSGWKGPRTIPDPPVPEALEYLAEALNFFDVQIFSSRSRYLGGRRAMRKWLIKHYLELAPDWKGTPVWLREIIAKHAFADPWEEEARWAIKALVKRYGFPKHKPPAMITLDDRAFQFNGHWPRFAELLEFQPWYKRTI